MTRFNVMIKASMRAGDHLASSVPRWSNAPNSHIVNLCCAIYHLPTIMYRLPKNNKVTNNVRYSSSRHYVHKVAGCTLFDRKKTRCNNAMLFSCNASFIFLGHFSTFGCFFLPLSIFINYFLLFQGGKVNYCGGGGAPLFIYFHFFYY